MRHQALYLPDSSDYDGDYIEPLFDPLLPTTGRNEHHWPAARRAWKQADRADRERHPRYWNKHNGTNPADVQTYRRQEVYRALSQQIARRERETVPARVYIRFMDTKAEYLENNRPRELSHQ